MAKSKKKTEQAQSPKTTAKSQNKNQKSVKKPSNIGGTKGHKVWVLERDVWGNVVDVFEGIYITTAQSYALIAYAENKVDTQMKLLEKAREDTVRMGNTDLFSVYPKTDVFCTSAEAQTACNNERRKAEKNGGKSA